MAMRTLLLILSAAVLSACASGQPRNELRTVDMAGGTVSWINQLRVSEVHKQAFPMDPGESLYLFTFARMASAQLSDGTIVRDEFNQPVVSCVRYAPLETEGFDECVAKLGAARAQLTDQRPSFERLINMSEQAVRAEGSCQWLGYDRALDSRARAVGAIARQDDARFFFAKLRCS